MLWPVFLLQLICTTINVLRLLQKAVPRQVLPKYLLGISSCSCKRTSEWNEHSNKERQSKYQQQHLYCVHIVFQKEACIDWRTTPTTTHRQSLQPKRSEPLLRGIQFSSNLFQSSGWHEPDLCHYIRNGVLLSFYSSYIPVSINSEHYKHNLHVYYYTMINCLSFISALNTTKFLIFFFFLKQVNISFNITSKELQMSTIIIIWELFNAKCKQWHVQIHLCSWVGRGAVLPK